MNYNIESLFGAKGDRVCERMYFTFRKPTSWKEVLFNPHTIAYVGDSVSTGNTVGKRMQRWFIDNGDFKSVVEKSLDTYDPNNQDFKDFLDKTSMWSTLAPNYYAQSLAGHTFFFFTTSIILRFTELFFQSTKNIFNFSALNGKYRNLVSLGLMAATLAFPYFCLGYTTLELLSYFLIPIFLENVLPFKWSNYLKRIHTLSNTKDFALKDFIFKHIQDTFIRLLFTVPTLYTVPALIYHSQNTTWVSRPAIIFCVEDRNIFIKNESAMNPWQWVGEIIGNIFGRIIFDLFYILILKTISENADLRNPMGWMFSKFRVQKQTKPWVLNKLQINKMDQGQKSHLAQKNNVNTTEGLPDIKWQETWPASEASITPESKFTININKKIKTRGKGQPQLPEKKINSISDKQQPCDCITIEVKQCTRTFHKLADEHCMKELWGVIINDSIEKNKLVSYENNLKGGRISKGGNIRRLLKGGYEMGSALDSRLLGNIHYGRIYDILQNHMNLDDAFAFSEKFENACERSQDMALIVFKIEAVHHDDIFQKAKRMKKK